ncbi:Transmembrane protein [Orchesella cincta]|uniref:Transmembrane protein n=1 Tax=Orchesella cincta TaxID=48709 RepID=A0A1D2MNX3_ORCCI|nr:Transmembrane protein [Orchesella cincta]
MRHSPSFKYIGKKMKDKTVVGLFLVSIACFCSGGAPYAVFSPHQYAFLDSNITFTAKIMNPNRDKYTIFWSETRWIANPRFLTIEMNKANEFQSDWSLNYPKDAFQAGNYTVSASIDYEWGPFPVDKPRQQAEEQNSVFQIEVDNPAFMESANVSWSWFNGTTSIANTTSPILKYNFTDSKTYPITAKLEATFVDSIKPNETVVKYGNFSANITAKVPIVSVNISGDTWYRNDGRLLRIKITCDGTGPYQYCLVLKEGAYNVTGNETCGSVEGTNDCEIPFAWLLGEGIHTLIIIIENDLSRYVNQTAIHVYKVARVQPLSLIIVPIACSLVALVLIIFGIGYFWENRKRFAVEVADFDFGQHDELPYMTFMERLKDAMSSSSVDRQRLIAPPDDEPVMTSRRSS